MLRGNERHTELGCYSGLPSSKEHARRLAKLGRTDPAYVKAVLEANQALLRAALDGRLQDVVRLSASVRPGDLIRKYVANAFLGACEKRHSLVVAFMLDQGVTSASEGVGEAMFKAISGFKQTPESSAATAMKTFDGSVITSPEAQVAAIAAAAGDAEGVEETGAKAETEDEAELRERVEASSEAEEQAFRDAGGRDAGARLDFVLGRLLAAGFDCNKCRSKTWDTPLHACARAGEPCGIVTLLESSGIDKAAVDHLDETPLSAVRAVISALGDTMTAMQTAEADTLAVAALKQATNAGAASASDGAASASASAALESSGPSTQLGWLSFHSSSAEVSLLARCMACEQLLVAAGAPGSWRRMPLTAADDVPGSDSWIARQTVKTMHDTVSETSESASDGGILVGKTKLSGGMSCGVGGFYPPSAEEMAAMPQMEFDDEDATSAEAPPASAAVVGAPMVQREADGGMSLSTA